MSVWDFNPLLQGHNLDFWAVAASTIELRIPINPFWIRQGLMGHALSQTNSAKLCQGTYYYPHSKGSEVRCFI